MKKQEGFTLIETLITMTIIAVLMGIALISYQGARKSARDGKRKADLEEIRGALEMCRADTGTYLSNLSFGEALTCDGNTYLDSIPVDPVNDAIFVYTYSGGEHSYTLCANRLETTGASYCLTNP